MYKDYLSAARKHQIRFAGKGCDMQPVPVSKRMNQTSNCNLRSCVLRPDRRHDKGSFFAIYVVGHSPVLANLE